MKRVEEEEISRLAASTPKLPEDFEDWCKKQMTRPLVYYRRDTKTSATYKCACCGRDYYTKTADIPEFGTLELETPRRGHPARCVHCGNQSFYEQMRVTRTEFDTRRFFLYQLTEENTLIVRFFTYFRKFSVNRRMEDILTEEGRFFLGYGQVKKLIRSYSYTRDENSWVLKTSAGYPYMEVMQGVTYPGWEDQIKKSTLKYCPLERLEAYIRKMYGNNKPDVTRIDALMAYANNPALEMYEKMGMTELVARLCARESIFGPVNRRKDTVKGQLRLKKKENINKLIKAKGNYTLLEILQYEEKMGFSWNEKQEEKIALIWSWDWETKKRITHLLTYMTVQQLINRVEKYSKQFYKKTGNTEFRWILIEYDDYLRLREELGYDMTNEVFIYPKELHEKSQEMIKESNARKDELMITKKDKKFPDIRKRYRKLCMKYQAMSDGYVIRPAESAGEIIMEGRILHHCVGGDNYLSKHNKGSSAILFLRKAKKPDVPYITIEIKGEEIIQWYGAHDKKPMKEYFDKYLSDYTKQLKQKENK